MLCRLQKVQMAVAGTARTGVRYDSDTHRRIFHAVECGVTRANTHTVMPCEDWAPLGNHIETEIGRQALSVVAGDRYE